MPRKRTLFALTLLLPVFLRAEPTMDWVKKMAQPLSFEFPYSQQLLDQIKAFKVITVGEIHGTEESPALVGLLIKNLSVLGRSTVLALEIPQSEQENIDHYLQSGDRAALRKSLFFSRPIEGQDGRSSQAMVDLLDLVRTLEGISVFCFDPNESTSGQDRDEKMAQNLIKYYKEVFPEHLVVLAGNIHSSVSKGNPFDPEYRSMGYELLHTTSGTPFLAQNILAIKLRNLSGFAWTCLQAGICKSNEMKFGPSIYSEAVDYPFYFLKEEGLYEGYEASLFARDYNASPPFVN